MFKSTYVLPALTHGRAVKNFNDTPHVEITDEVYNDILASKTVSENILSTVDKMLLLKHNENYVVINKNEYGYCVECFVYDTNFGWGTDIFTGEEIPVTFYYESLFGLVVHLELDEDLEKYIGTCPDNNFANTPEFFYQLTCFKGIIPLNEKDTGLCLARVAEGVVEGSANIKCFIDEKLASNRLMGKQCKKFETTLSNKKDSK